MSEDLALRRLINTSLYVGTNGKCAHFSPHKQVTNFWLCSFGIQNGSGWKAFPQVSICTAVGMLLT